MLTRGIYTLARLKNCNNLFKLYQLMDAQLSHRVPFPIKHYNFMAVVFTMFNY